METPVLIYCAGNNRRFDEIALKSGFKTGAQLPTATPCFPPYFVDQDWKKPERASYMKSLKQHRPMMATVLDLERKEQLTEILSWAGEAAHYVKIVVIIPKVSGVISEIPEWVGSAKIMLGYSVPTRYGGTSVPIWEFSGWPVHLLGGNPKKQHELSKYMNVVSVDGNYATMCATKFCKWFDGRTWHRLKNDKGELWGKDAPYECFRRSCEGIKKMWRE